MQCARLARLPSVRCPVRRTDAGFAATSKYAGCRITRAPPSRAGAESSGPYMNEKYGWKFEEVKTHEGDTRVKILPVASIRRPFKGVRGNDTDKVQALMESIEKIGLQEPIDVLEVDGVYYGFNGCHRYEAHERLGLPTIKCRVRKASKELLRMHMM